MRSFQHRPTVEQPGTRSSDGFGAIDAGGSSAARRYAGPAPSPTIGWRMSCWPSPAGDRFHQHGESAMQLAAPAAPAAPFRRYLITPDVNA